MSLRPFLARQRARVASWWQRAATASLYLATLILSQPAFADLPTQTAPQGVDAGDVIGMWRTYARIGFNVLILIVGTVGFISVASGALEKWRQYGKGKIELTEMKEYIVGGVMVLVVIVFLLTVANTIL